MRRVRHKSDPDQWGYVDMEGYIKGRIIDLPIEHKIVRVLWANDLVSKVPPSLQYADDLEDI